MIDREKLELLEKNGGAAGLKLRDELAAAMEEQVSGVSHAVAAYFDDVAQRKRRIADRVNDLREQREDLETEIAAYGPRLADVTISGDTEAMNTIQRELADMEANKAALSSQIELLGSVTVHGDEAIYHHADELAEAMEREYSGIAADLQELVAFANKQIELWTSVANLSTVGGNTVPVRSVRERVRQMRQDFQADETPLSGDF